MKEYKLYASFYIESMKAMKTKTLSPKYDVNFSNLKFLYSVMYRKCMNIQIILINLTRKMQISQELRHKCNIIIMHFGSTTFYNDFET